VQAVAAVRLLLTLLVPLAVLATNEAVARPWDTRFLLVLLVLFAMTFALNGYIFWLSSRQRIDRFLLPLAIIDSLLISEASYITGGIASPLQPLLLFPIGQLAITVSLRAAVGVSLLIAALYSLLVIDPIATSSLNFIRISQSSRPMLERLTLLNVLISDICFVAFAVAAGWIGEAARGQESRLLERSSRLRGEVLLLSRLAKATSRHTDLAPVLETVLQTVGVELAAERAVVFLGEQDDGSLRAHASHGFDADPRGLQEVLEDTSVAVRAMRERRVIQGKHRSRIWGKTPGSTSTMAAPLMVGSTCLGCLYLDSGMRYHRWGRDSHELLSAIADLTAVAIQNANLYAATTYEQSKLQATIGAVSDAMLLYDSDSKVLLANRRFLDMFGLPNQVQGLALTSLPGLCRAKLLPGDAFGEEQIQSVWSNLLLGTDSDVDLLVPTRTFQRHLAPVHDEQGQQFATILTLHDITDEQQSALARDEILASVSHELRTPLTTVKGYTQIFIRRLQRGDGHFSEHEFELVLEQIERLTHLIDELLDVSRLPTRRGSPRTEPVDLRDIVSRVVERIGSSVPHRRILLETPPVPIFGRWNTVRIAQALDNILNNALKYSPDETTVYVRMDDTDGNVTLSVRDEGIGVSGEHTSQIFEPFFRIDNSTTRRTGGLGLGLYVSRLIAEQHGGSLTVDSEPGSGSTFRISLPTERTPA